MADVTEVQVHFVKPQDGLIGFASCVLDGSVYLAGIGIHRKLDGSGYRLTYPTRKVCGKNLKVFHPINVLTAKKIEQAVFCKVKDVLEKSNVGYCSAYVELYTI